MKDACLDNLLLTDLIILLHVVLKVPFALCWLCICTDDMSSCSFSNLSEFNDTAFGWATDQCFLRPRKQRNVLFDLFLTRFGKTSRRAARAVRDFVTCSSPQSNGFSTEDVTTTSQRSPTDVQDSQDETPSTTSNLQTLRDKPGRDDWSNRNGTTSPTRRFSRKLDFNDRERHPHWKNTHDQVCVISFLNPVEKSFITRFETYNWIPLNHFLIVLQPTNVFDSWFFKLRCRFPTYYVPLQIWLKYHVPALKV